MYTLSLENMVLSVDFKAGRISSVVMNSKERIASVVPLFRIRLRNKDAETSIVTAYDAGNCSETAKGAIYSRFTGNGKVDIRNMSVEVTLTEENGEAAWKISVAVGNDDTATEWIDFPLVTLPKLKENNELGSGGEILYPYNEGALISNIDFREQTWFKHKEPEYPSHGNYSVFPNMICSQLLAYVWDDVGLYIGAHDTARAVKGIDYYATDGGVTFQFRLYCGTDFGEEFKMNYPIIWSAVGGRWEAAAERYRKWFEENLPPEVKKISENKALPDWYFDSPLVVTYPVRGIHDMDDMKPNALYPYTNALPLLDGIRSATNSRLLVLLMHWEGTAPWAPPYVWPPYGGVDNFNEFMNSLHKKGDVLGVYCSGFGYTIQSNLIADYNKQKEYDERGLVAGMCASPTGKVEISNICRGQRSGYDICPASETGRKILSESYNPLFNSRVDYAQILDQNHGGGQYFCYSREHGHPPVPGEWMTRNMQDMLSEWNQKAPDMLFGCESAAAEPFIGNIAFSDNRFELNYMLGKPVPMYAYIYHEYVRNFMGNQVCCPFNSDIDTLRYRIAYSFSIGDSMTLVLAPDGKLMTNWGTRDFEHSPDKEKALALISNLTTLYASKAKDYLCKGRMIVGYPVECATLSYECDYPKRTVVLPKIISSAWQLPSGKRVQILVNPEDSDTVCNVNGTEITVPALDGIVFDIQ